MTVEDWRKYVEIRGITDKFEEVIAEIIVKGLKEKGFVIFEVGIGSGWLVIDAMKDGKAYREEYRKCASWDIDISKELLEGGIQNRR